MNFANVAHGVSLGRERRGFRFRWTDAARFFVPSSARLVDAIRALHFGEGARNPRDITLDGREANQWCATRTGAKSGCSFHLRRDLRSGRIDPPSHPPVARRPQSSVG
jgi:hypothetical protein